MIFIFGRAGEGDIGDMGGLRNILGIYSEEFNLGYIKCVIKKKRKEINQNLANSLCSQLFSRIQDPQGAS